VGVPRSPVQKPLPRLGTDVNPYSAHQFVHCLAKELAVEGDLSDRWYETFDHTFAGHDGCHSRTLEVLRRVCGKMPGVATVTREGRFNLPNGVRFWPDVVGWGRNGRVKVAVDFESPNSSDVARPDAYLPPAVDGDLLHPGQDAPGRAQRRTA
jgi:hypothetical protein